jgi:superfamily II DNA or RNA helicase
MKQTILGGSIIRDYLEHAKGTRALAFAVNVEHSLAIVEQARAAGITAEHVDADTPSSIRAALLGRGGKFETGEVMFVSNCMIMSEGTDVPSIQTLLLMRPTASLVLALQMIGRGLRPWCFTCRDAPRPTCVGHDVKRVCRIHDHANVLETHGLPDEDRPMSLDMDAPPKPAPVSTCRKCNAMFPSGHTTCPRCGAPIETVTGMSGREITEDGDARRLTIEEIRARRKEGLDELTDAELMRVHKATREEKAAEYLRLIRVRDERGLKEKFPDAAYRAVFGVWPKFDDEFLAGITPATRSFIPYKRRS